MRRRVDVEYVAASVATLDALVTVAAAAGPIRSRWLNGA